MSMKFKKTLALVLSLVTVFSAAFTSLAEIPSGVEEPVEVAEIGGDQAVIVEDPLEEVSDIFNTATPEEMAVLENVEEVVEVVEDGLTEGGVDPTVIAEANPMGADGEVKVYSWTELKAAITSANTPTTIKLMDDLQPEEPESTDADIIISIGKDITLDLNGHTLDRHLSDPWGSKDGEGTVIVVTGTSKGAGKLTIIDSDPEQKGTITGGNPAAYNGGGLLIRNLATVIMKGGNITGNSSDSHYGGGVSVEYSTFIMEGGKITNNSASKGGWNLLLCSTGLGA